MFDISADSPYFGDYLRELSEFGYSEDEPDDWWDEYSEE